MPHSPRLPRLHRDTSPTPLGNPTFANVILNSAYFLWDSPVGLSPKRCSSHQGAVPNVLKGPSLSREDAAAPSNLGCSSEHPRFHLSICPCTPSTLSSPPHFEGHANLSRSEMKTMVVSAAGPSLFLRPQFARHWFVLQKKR